MLLYKSKAPTHRNTKDGRREVKALSAPRQYVLLVMVNRTTAISLMIGAVASASWQVACNSHL